MNIFILDENPIKAAEYLCDKHCVKMILESAQILSTVAHSKGYSGFYKPTHKNHPCVKWVEQAPENWFWLLVHAEAICAEYTDRYNKTHKSEQVIRHLGHRSKNIWFLTIMTQFLDIKFEGDMWKKHTPFVQCMPEQYKQSNAVEAYRAYYKGEKAAFAKWKSPSFIPDWFKL